MNYLTNVDNIGSAMKNKPLPEINYSASSWDPIREKNGVIGNKLKVGIGLVMGTMGELVEVGREPSAVHWQPLYGTLGETYENRKRWRLTDQDANFTICLEIDSLDATHIGLQCTLEKESGDCDGNPSDVFIAVLNDQNRQAHVSGVLAHFEDIPLVIPVGAWIIRIEATHKTVNLVWEIPLELQINES